MMNKPSETNPEQLEILKRFILQFLPSKKIKEGHLEMRLNTSYLR